MNINQKILRSTNILALIAVAFLMSACQSTPEKDTALEQVRSELTDLQSNSQLANLAQTSIQEAERAVRAAEEVDDNKDLREHLVYIASNKVKIAKAQASARYEENQLQKIGEKRQEVLLQARTTDAQRAEQRADSLEKELSDLKQKQTERGTMYTFGDTLFSTGKADLKTGSQANFNRLATALKENPERKIVIEGHTDSMGSDDYNLSLSQQRADAVKNYLVANGVDADRITAIGKGEGFPVASNDTAAGRQQNRRVEVIVEGTN